MKMNWEAAEKGLQYLEAEPRRFDMMRWVSDASDKSFELLEEKPPCGTVCCFAGAIALAHAKDPKKVTAMNAEYLAHEALGTDRTHELFCLTCWPKEFSDLYAKAITQAERVAALRAYIERLKEEQSMSGERFYIITVPDPYEPADSGMRVSRTLAWKEDHEPDKEHHVIGGPFATREEANRVRSD